MRCHWLSSFLPRAPTARAADLAGPACLSKTHCCPRRSLAWDAPLPQRRSGHLNMAANCRCLRTLTPCRCACHCPHAPHAPYTRRCITPITCPHLRAGVNVHHFLCMRTARTCCTHGALFRRASSLQQLISLHLLFPHLLCCSACLTCTACLLPSPPGAWLDRFCMPLLCLHCSSRQHLGLGGPLLPGLISSLPHSSSLTGIPYYGRMACHSCPPAFLCPPSSSALLPLHALSTILASPLPHCLLILGWIL